MGLLIFCLFVFSSAAVFTIAPFEQRICNKTNQIFLVKSNKWKQKPKTTTNCIIYIIIVIMDNDHNFKWNKKWSQANYLQPSKVLSTLFFSLLIAAHSTGSIRMPDHVVVVTVLGQPGGSELTFSLNFKRILNVQD